ncbi:carbohydrate ABC transporter permease [Pyrobaculum aerophilum]|uniref:ABC transmembrane type-1 domain-containing protein n=1 Tax=Pyrobaculum aerophilum TaxID=13773 RepID=A0A371R1S5_9CREN|nr:sugar ABC transporter permease [Pyrobaculum aerophilum]RFA94191.1 hypothetical protein CGL51_11015 [Pyrobaculum aerophilum]RFA97515.1 hypothetical protein CGL52_08935 [Pyrobaculum aerophilum]
MSFFEPAGRAKWLMASPGLLFLVTYIAAIAYTAYLSLHQWSLTFTQSPEFIGLANYARLFSDYEFVNSLKVTLVFVATSSLIEIGLAVVLAYWLVWERRRGVLTTLLAVPLVVPVAAYVVYWSFALDFRRGLLGQMAQALGLSAPNILGDPSTALWAIVGLDVLQMTPFYVLIITAGFLDIPSEVWSAARIDGASGFHIALKVAIPAARNAILATLFLKLIDSFRIFAKVWLLTKGGPGNATSTLELYLYTRGIYPLDVGFGSTISMAILLVSATVIVPYIYLALRQWRL